LSQGKYLYLNFLEGRQIIGIIEMDSIFAEVNKTNFPAGSVKNWRFPNFTQIYVR